MTRIYVDATTLIALGEIGELGLLTAFDGQLVVVPAVRAEVTTQPAAANLDRFCRRDEVETAVLADGPSMDGYVTRARTILDESDVNGDVRLVAAVLATTDADERVAIVSDDRRLRTVADGLGATVTGTIGVIARAVEAGLPADDAKAVLRRIDSNGLHLTAELFETAMDLIEEAGQ